MVKKHTKHAKKTNKLVKKVKASKSGKVTKRVKVKHSKKHSKKVSKHKSQTNKRKALLDLMTVPQTYGGQIGDQATVLASSASTGILCAYFTFNANSPFGSRNPTQLLKIANLAVNQGITSTGTQGTGTGNLNAKFYQSDFHVQHRLCNQSNRPIKVTAYYCSWRRDIPTATEYNDMLSLLGQGFALGGINPTVPTSSNAGLVRADLTPYQSISFVEAINITKVKVKHILPGHVQHYKVADNQEYVIHPNQFISLANGQTFLTGTQLVDYKKSESFILFRMEADFVGNDSITQTLIANGSNIINMVSEYQYTWKEIADLQISNTEVAPVRIGVLVGTETIMTGGAYTQSNANNA